MEKLHVYVLKNIQNNRLLKSALWTSLVAVAPVVITAASLYLRGCLHLQ